MIRPMHLDQNSAVIEKSDEKSRVIVPEAAPSMAGMRQP
jgi:hypothetical protein